MLAQPPVYMHKALQQLPLQAKLGALVHHIPRLRTFFLSTHIMLNKNILQPKKKSENKIKDTTIRLFIP